MDMLIEYASKHASVMPIIGFLPLLCYSQSMEDTRPKLKDITAFQRILADYHVSKHAQKVLDESRLVVMSGLAGGGRNTIINRLVEQYDYFFLV